MRDKTHSAQGMIANMADALWWAMLGVGVLVYTATAFGTIRAYGSEPVPRLGFWPDFSTHRPPWWTWLVLTGGIALMAAATSHLATEYTATLRYWLLLIVAAAVSWVLQIALVRAHNRRVGTSQAPMAHGDNEGASSTTD
jgi:hypothetical protein